MAELLNEITAHLAEATLAVGTSCAAYARVLDAVSDETVTVDELTEAEAIAWRAHQTMCSLSLRHEALLAHIRQLLLVKGAPGWTLEHGHVYYDVDSLQGDDLRH